jgi:hypothetical protein
VTFSGFCYTLSMKSSWRLALVCLFFAACSTTPKETPPPAEFPAATPKIDYAELQNRLGVELPMGGTGFREKSFDACDLGPALVDLVEPLKDCHHAYFILVQFQLSCRQNEESTGILTESDLTPVSNQNLKWKIDHATGETQTDFQGQGAIRAISGRSLRKGMLRLSTGVDFLNMRVEQATAIVTPASWCKMPVDKD